MSELRTGSSPVPSRRARAEGGLIAHAAGDALGWPQESSYRRLGEHERPPTTRFEDWERRSGGRFFAHREPIRAGEYSDDTQLTLAVARCRIHGGGEWWACLTRHELPLWTLYERGGGGATKRAARCWTKNVLPWKQRNAKEVDKYFKAGGNGVAMRVIPHAVHCADHSVPEGMLRDVLKDGAATHGHPRALVGAAAYAYAAWWLLKSNRTLEFGEIVSVLLNDVSLWGVFPSGASSSGWEHEAWSEIGNYEEAWSRTVGEMCHLLEHVERGLSAGSLADDAQVLDALGAFGPWKGAGTVCAAAALYLTARYAANPTEGVVRAAFAIGSDTDTIAAMTGGLLGMLAGDEWIPPDWRVVQDVDYLRQVADELVSREKVPPLPELPRPVGARDLRDLTRELLDGPRSTFSLQRLRSATVIQDRRLEPLSRTTVVRAWKLKTGDGQTLYVTKLSRKSKPKSPSRKGETDGLLQSSTGDIHSQDRDARGTARDVEATGAIVTRRAETVSTESFKPILDRDVAVENASGLVELTSPMLREAINYSTQAFARIVQTGPGSMHNAAFAAPVVLFRHIIEVTDAIDVSLSNSCVHPAKLMLRGSFEAMLCVQYICDDNAERRALAWLYNDVRDRIRWHESVRDARLSDELMRKIDDELLGRIEQELQRFQAILDAPYMRDVVSEVQKQDRYRHWYSLWNGPQNLWELARHLDRLDDYELLYRRWSSEAHASSGLRKTFHLDDDDRQSIAPIRSPVDMIDVANSARAFLLHALLVIIDRFRPGEEAQRAEWYKTEMRPLIQQLRNTSITFDVTPHKW